MNSFKWQLLLILLSFVSCHNKNINKYLGQLPYELQSYEAECKRFEKKWKNCKDPEQLTKIALEANIFCEDFASRYENAINQLNFPVEIPLRTNVNNLFDVNRCELVAIETYSPGNFITNIVPYKMYCFQSAVTFNRDTISVRPLSAYCLFKDTNGGVIAAKSNIITPMVKGPAVNSFKKDSSYIFKIELLNNQKLLDFDHIEVVAESKYLSTIEDSTIQNY